MQCKVATTPGDFVLPGAFVLPENFQRLGRSIQAWRTQTNDVRWRFRLPPDTLHAILLCAASTLR